MNFLTILPARFLSFKFFLLFLAASLIATLTLTLPLAATAEAVEPAPTLQELTSAFLNGEVSTLAGSGEDEFDSLQSMLYPSGRVITYVYDGV